MSSFVMRVMYAVLAPWIFAFQLPVLLAREMVKRTIGAVHTAYDWILSFFASIWAGLPIKEQERLREELEWTVRELDATRRVSDALKKVGGINLHRQSYI